MGKTWRPNVQTVSESSRQTKGDYAFEQKMKKRKDGKHRVFTSDWCDFCLQVKFLKKWQLSMRVRGWRFICFKCSVKHNLDPFEKKNKLFLVFDARPGTGEKQNNL